MNQDAILNIIRSVLKVGGGMIVADGLATSDQWIAISGGIVALIGAVWSYWVSKKQTAAIAAQPPK